MFAKYGRYRQDFKISYWFFFIHQKLFLSAVTIVKKCDIVIRLLHTLFVFELNSLDEPHRIKLRNFNPGHIEFIRIDFIIMGKYKWIIECMCIILHIVECLCIEHLFRIVTEKKGETLFVFWC